MVEINENIDWKVNVTKETLYINVLLIQKLKPQPQK